MVESLPVTDKTPSSIKMSGAISYGDHDREYVVAYHHLTGKPLRIRRCGQFAVIHYPDRTSVKLGRV